MHWFYRGRYLVAHAWKRGCAGKQTAFVLAFELLNLNRVETGCLISNHASRRSIEKTQGFQYEGTQRESGINAKGEFED
jgi:ribosomal-protein-serine acetyltransferase